MKLLIALTLFVAAASSKAAPPYPLSHTLEVAHDGTVGDSVFSPLVSLIVNLSKYAGNLVSFQGLPQPAPSPVAPGIPDIVTQPEVPAIPESPVVVPGGQQVPIVPEPPIVVPGGELPVVPGSPIVIPGGQVPIAPVTPIVVPGSPVDLPAAVVLPESPAPIVVDPAEPKPVIVVDGPESAEPETALEPAAEDSTSGVTNNYFINVLLNFFNNGEKPNISTSGSSLESLLQFLGRPSSN